MKTVAVLGAGLVSAPMVRYLPASARAGVVVADQSIERAQAVAAEHPGASARALHARDDEEPLAQAEAKWIQGFQELAPTAEIEPAQALGLLVGLSFKDSPHLGALRNDPAQVKGRAIVVSRSLFNTIRAEMPVFMLLEDLHWADSSSLDYLLRVLLNSGAHANGLFVLATARPPVEYTPPLTSTVSPFHRRVHGVAGSRAPP